MQEFDLVHSEQLGATRILTLTNPARRNALSRQMMLRLTQQLSDASRSKETAVVVLAADGGVFSSGHDLRELAEAGPEASAEIFACCMELMETVQSIPQPVIAEVQGLATAAGCQLVAACDLAVASDQARFATPGVKIGLFCSTPMVALTRAIGRKRAMEMLLTGRTISAQEAADWGLVNRVVEPDRLRSAVLELAGQICTASSTVVGIGKRAFYGQVELPQHDAYLNMTAVMSSNSQESDAREGICAFLEKRAPVWGDR